MKSSWVPRNAVMMCGVVEHLPLLRSRNVLCAPFLLFGACSCRRTGGLPGQVRGGLCRVKKALWADSVKTPNRRIGVNPFCRYGFRRVWPTTRVELMGVMGGEVGA